MKTYEPTRKTLNKIKRTLRIKKYTLDQFFAACPFTLEELQSKNRRHELICWRHLGMAWGLLSGDILKMSSSRFSRTHASALNGLTSVLHAVEGFGSPYMAEAIQRVMEHATVDGVLVPSYSISAFLDRHIGDPDVVARLTPKLFELINNEATR